MSVNFGDGNRRNTINKKVRLKKIDTNTLEGFEVAPDYNTTVYLVMDTKFSRTMTKGGDVKATPSTSSSIEKSMSAVTPVSTVSSKEATAHDNDGGCLGTKVPSKRRGAFSGNKSLTQQSMPIIREKESSHALLKMRQNCRANASLSAVYSSSRFGGIRPHSTVLSIDSDGKYIDNNSLTQSHDTQHDSKIKQHRPSSLQAMKNFTYDRSMKPLNSVVMKARFIENTNHVIVTGDLGASHPRQLARKLFDLIGVTKDQVSRILCRQDPYHTEACREYMNLLKMEGLRIDQALRLLMEKIPLIGETHAIEGMMTHFTRRYHQVNSNISFSENSCHILVCSLLILNSDLHSNIKMKKMTLQDYTENVLNVCKADPSPPSPSLLKELYESIKSNPLPFQTSTSSSAKITKKAKVNTKRPRSRTADSVRLETKMETDLFPVIRSGALYCKLRRASNHSIVTRLKRTWKLSFVSLKGLNLIFHRKPDDVSSPEMVIHIHHSCSGIYSGHQSRINLFYLRLPDDKFYIFEDSTSAGSQQWVSYLNLSAALLSTPTLPISVGNPPFLCKYQCYPSQAYNGSIKDLYETTMKREKELTSVLELVSNYATKKAEEIQMVKKSIAFIKGEIDRYGKYRMHMLYSTPEHLKTFLHPKNTDNLVSFMELAATERSRLNVKGSIGQ